MKDDSNFWVEELNDLQSLPLKRKRNVRSKRLEYTGWGSIPLIEFLHSVGKDTSKKLSQYDVAAIITEYVKAHNLVNPDKKKKIICDGRLHSLFGKKVVSRIKIYDLLEPHFTENQDNSEDDFGSEEDDTQYVREKKTSNSESKPSIKKNKVPEILKSCFAAVIPENIRLVYLKRTLIQDLIKVPESFEEKLLGSFVRIKSDPHDFRQKLSHQLQQVIGVRMTSEAGNSSFEVALQLSDYFKEVSTNMLSDDNFSEEECDNLQERVKSGLLKRPTVVELEAKARMLHGDITKHWIPREISRLQKLIDRANEKGWRRELYEYLEKKQLLQKPSEQERLLSEIPKVIADKLEPEVMPDALEKVEDGNISPKSEKGISNMNGSVLDEIPPAFVNSDSADHVKENVCGVSCPKYIDGSPAAHDMSIEVKEIDCENEGMPAQELRPAEVINLSDDEAELEVAVQKQSAAPPSHPEDKVWFYLDPQGEVQGPFPMTILKRWSDANYFHPTFRVWKIGQRQDEAVLLLDMLRQVFH